MGVQVQGKGCPATSPAGASPATSTFRPLPQGPRPAPSIRAGRLPEYPCGQGVQALVARPIYFVPVSVAPVERTALGRAACSLPDEADQPQ